MINRELKICEFNVENLFISMEYYSDQDLRQISEEEWKKIALAQFQKLQKPLAKLWGISKAILEIDPDIVMLIEVGGKDSLENFNTYFLSNKFQTYFIGGNSRRGIDLGFLVKKDLPFHTACYSNKETPIEVSTYQGKYLSRFSRDVAELHLSNHSQLQLIILLIHFKSKISTEQDFRGKDVRTAEAMALTQIYKNLRSKYKNVPVIVGGDFNTDLASLELEFIKQTDLEDVHDLLNTPTDARTSLVYFDYNETPRLQILDYLLVSPEIHDRIVASKTYTYRYKGFYDIPENLPSSLRERHKMPSDHYPLVLTIQLPFF